MTRRRWLIPYLLLIPGLLWLAIFFVLPNIQMFLMSMSERSGGTGLQRQYELTWTLDNYIRALTDFPEQFANSLVYGGLATLLCLLIGYPLAYGIAFRGGRYKSLLLFLVIAPFFTSFLIRTISWRIILGNDGAFLSIVRDGLGIVPPNFSILGTPLAVVSGLTYQFLPFMVLPLYVSLEKIDRRLVEAAKDLYAGPWRPRGSVVGGVSGAVLAVVIMAALGYMQVDAGNLPGIAATALVGALVGGLIATYLISESFVRIILPAEPRRRVRGLHPDVHPGHRRLRERRAPWQSADADDRQRHPEPVSRPERLSDRRSPVVPAHGRHPDRDLHLRARARDRGADRRSRMTDDGALAGTRTSPWRDPSAPASGCARRWIAGSSPSSCPSRCST